MKEFEYEPGEQLVKEARKHWLLFALELLPFALLAAIPFFIADAMRLVPQLIPYADKINYKDPLWRAALGVWLLITWTGAWAHFTRYFLNAWVLTNKRIVTIKQRAFFNREVSSLLLPRVQDVTTEVTGLLPSLLNIGNIKVQTAAEDVEFVMRGIPRPEQMRDIIMRYVSAKSQNDAT